MITILVQRKTVYGRTHYYPANVAAVALAMIAGTTTLKATTLKLAIEHLGVQVALEHEPLDLSQEN